MSRLTALERALVALALAGALVWLVASARGEAGGALLAAKAAPAVLLAAIAAGRSAAPRDGLLALALVLHAAGDVLLEVAFLAGLAAFLAGHLAYLALFWPARRAVDELGGATKLGLGALALLGALFLALLGPGLEGARAAAVPLYVAALLAMAGAALVSGRGQPWVSAGALLFVASDALLGLELFLGLGGSVEPAGARSLPGLAVWPLYVAAQLALALGWVRGGDTAVVAGAAAGRPR